MSRLVRASSTGDSNCLRSSKLKALKGRPIVAQGKRVRERCSYIVTVTLPLTVKPRDSANLICGILPVNFEQRR